MSLTNAVARLIRSVWQGPRLFRVPILAGSTDTNVGAGNVFALIGVETTDVKTVITFIRICHKKLVAFY